MGDFHDDLNFLQHHIERVTVSGSAFLVLSILFVGLRLFARWKFSSTNWGCDDLFILPALFSEIVLLVSAIINSRFIQLSFESLALNDQATVGRNTIYANIAVYIGSIAFQPACAFAKLSICCMFLRFQTGRLERAGTYGIIIFVATSCGILTGLSAGVCSPIKLFWNKDLPYGHCLDIYALEVSRSVPHIASDLAMLALPVPILRKLRISFRKKLGLALMFGTASVGLVACCARLSFYIKFYKEANGAVVEDEKETIRVQVPHLLLGNILTMLEATTYLVAANCPPIRPLLSHIRKAWRLPRRNNLGDLNTTEYDPRIPHILSDQSQRASNFGENLRAEVAKLFRGPSRMSDL